jgi:cAMP and cAMP-inhibited cGMP 3',5'-cyclic phosphodiesterase 10
MLNFKIDLSKAREKRTRQLQYSNEIRSGTASSQGGREKLALEIDSVTRLVVQSFRKLIDCERCALFLLDDKTNELYFKPVGDGANSLARLKEIRFPASSGVAGWCASNKLMLNIKNAYHDARFNTDVDMKTGFKTRTILCHPVLSSNNKVLGVVQMVNKKKTQQKGHELVKKKGYDSMYEHFSAKDEEILGKCCAEVSKSLELIYSKRGDRRQQTPKMTNRQSSDEKENRIVVFSDDAVASSLISNCDARSRDPVKSETDSTSCRNSVEKSADDTDSASFRPEKQPTGQDISKRRSSVGELAHFIKQAVSEANDVKADNQDITPTRRRSSVVETAGIAEAVQKFRFRAPDIDVLRNREMERRLSDANFQIAESKRKRMQEYGEGVRSMEKEEQSIEAASPKILPPRDHVTARQRSSVAQLTPFIQQPGPANEKAEVDRSRRRSWP